MEVLRVAERGVSADAGSGRIGKAGGEKPPAFPDCKKFKKEGLRDWKKKIIIVNKAQSNQEKEESCFERDS